MRNKRFIAAAAIAGMLVGVPAASAAGSKLITGNDVKNGSLTAKDISPNTLNSWKDYFKGGTRPQGPMGPIGLTGPQGVKGDTGARGPVGPAGIGINGADGANGEDGKQGPQGDTGAPGTNGVDGVNGKSAYELYAEQRGNTMTQLEWQASLKGKDGTNGVDGAQGAKGDKGDKGDRGDIGPKGYAGTNGKNGVSGYTFNQNIVNIADAGPDTVWCPDGKVALGGGASPSFAGATAAIYVSQPEFANSELPPTGWTIKYNGVTNVNAKAILYVTCADAS